MFEENEKQLYRMLGKSKIEVKEHPSVNEITNFWSEIWSSPTEFNKDAQWFQDEKEKYENNEEMDFENIDMDCFKHVLGEMQNWKAPGHDSIQNFWIKRFDALHPQLLKNINLILHGEVEMPLWMTQGSTILLPKTNDTKAVKNYRPITCLSGLYKLFTALISKKVYAHLIENNIFPAEQKGCAQKSLGCKEALILNKAVMKNAKSKNKNLAMGWIDYKKAYDTIPHDLIIHLLRIYRINHKIIKVCQNMMANWCTKLKISSDDMDHPVETDLICIRRGIFQGDSYSPLLFCLCLMPLSRILNAGTMGYQLVKNEKPINHILYMDDLKLFGKNENELKMLLDLVARYSIDIKMEFGVEKCAKAIVQRGKLVITENIKINEEMEIKQLEQDNTYKYLGIEESNEIECEKMKKLIEKEYKRRLRMILSSELNARNKIQALNTLAVPVLQYSFGIIDWRLDEIRQFDYDTRKFLTMYGMFHPRSDVHRFRISKADYITKAIKIINEYHDDESDHDEDELRAHEKIRSFKPKEAHQNRLKNKWQEKALHGQYLQRVNKEGNDVSQTFSWLSRGQLKPATEATIVAAQDQALRTRNYEKYVLKTTDDDRCRICQEKPETIDHILSACSQLAKHEYILRHNKICAYVHWCLCKKYKIPDTSTRWYEHEPKPVVTNEEITIIYDQQIHTDRTVPANKPDIVVKNVKDKKCVLIDVSVPCDANLISKEAEKKLKYRTLAIEVSKMWNLKTIIVPVIIGALGTIPKTLGENIKKLEGDISLHKIQDIALCGSAQILRKTIY
ncbi:hypothetical protein M8J77_007684 [Diaphorina citri]|nr:hypothetical protein M8J77_007684 [Diaphorina citri]